MNYTVQKKLFSGWLFNNRNQIKLKCICRFRSYLKLYFNWSFSFQVQISQTQDLF